ncbi:GH32 C-terminal domain-containing protein [Clostridium perfringens]|uniref:GH32 C-terminal domain-containing protein n=1 Tax=Clostridium perfringens TaxID=1502 RepID=UPI0039EBDB27|nr:GH32 C-terminal domain-containing protein [Clostridium perfringens]
MELEFSLIILKISNKNFILSFKSNKNEKLEFIVDLVEGSLVLNRDYRTKGIKEEYRKIFFNLGEVNNENIKIRIFLDKSSIEVFVNDDECVFTSRIYPECEKNIILSVKEISLNNLIIFNLKN